MLDSTETIVDRIERFASDHPDRVAFRFLVDGTADGAFETWTYATLSTRARAVAAELRARGLADRPALLLYPSGLEFVAAFFGCLYAGTIAVPAYPPDPSRLARTLPRLVAMAADASAAAVLTSTEIAAMSRTLAAFAPDLAQLPWIATDALRDGSDPPAPRSEVAFLQYTSGSTSDPKGVVVTHANLVHNQRVLVEAFGLDDRHVPLGWLPLFHDMGLVGHVMNPVWLGTTGILMAPHHFLRRPVEWVRAIHRFRATTSGAPDFAYGLCARKVTDAELAELDLSCWQVAYCGAETVRAATMRGFADRMARAGFRPGSQIPCYGLAESTLMATSVRRGRGVSPIEVDARALSAGRLEAATGRETTLVGVGGPFLGTEVRVVDPDRRTVLEEGRIGEIWLRGPSVARGYWRSPEATEATFGARTADGDGPFLRTGDLGALRGGELYVTGRAKDLVVLRGANLHPEDLERAIEGAVPSVRPGCSAAFGVEVAGEERIAVACEAEGVDAQTLAEEVRGAVAAAADGAAVYAVAVLAKGGLPKTSSGKRQRAATRRAFREGTLGELARIVFPDPPTDADEADAEPPPSTLPEMEAWLARQAAAVLGVPADRVARDATFESMGFDSVRVVELASRLDARLGRPLHPSILFNVPTVARLAAWLVQGVQSAAAPAPDAPYDRLDLALARLDRRDPSAYRFDLEADIPWDRVGEPGDYAPAALLATFGVNAEPIAAEPDAWALLQAASALTICAAFEVAEVTITLFIDTRWQALGATRSLELFREEEDKHVRLFRRYARALGARHPDLVGQLGWDPAWGVGFWELFRSPELFPDERVFHYLFWFFFVAFEEHSIYLADLVSSGTSVQPAWARAHLMHRREELQHVATDHAYLGALALDPAERDAWSEVAAAWLCQHFDTFFAFGPARRLVARRFPHLAPHLRTGGFLGSPFLQDLLHAPVFRRTRLACPYLRDLEQLDPGRWPTDAELARRLPAAWMQGRSALVPSAVDLR